MVADATRCLGKRKRISSMILVPACMDLIRCLEEAGLIGGMWKTMQETVRVGWTIECEGQSGDITPGMFRR